MTAAFALCEHPNRLGTDAPNGVGSSVQLLARYGLGEADVDHHFGGRIDFSRVIGILAWVGVTCIGRDRAQTRLAPDRRGRRRRRSQQRVVLAFGELLLHLSAYTPVLPPIEQQHQEDEHYAQQDQTDLQITHCQPRPGHDIASC